MLPTLELNLDHIIILFLLFIIIIASMLHSTSACN